MKKIVVPGELVSSERKKLGGNVYVANGKVYSKVLGITEEEGDIASVVALEGKYMPTVGDVVIGVVNRVVFAGFGINLNSFSDCFIPKSGMREELKQGDVIMGKIEYVNEMREADLEFPRKVFGGEIIQVTAVRTPRLIGKNGSMLDLLKRGTGCELIIGKNGRIWARGGNIELLKKVVKFIDKNSYKSNLTSSIEGLFGIEANSPAPQMQQERVAPNANAKGFAKKAQAPVAEATKATDEFETIEIEGADEASNQSPKDDSEDAA